eukprot:g1110.t1
MTLRIVYFSSQITAVLSITDSKIIRRVGGNDSWHCADLFDHCSKLSSDWVIELPINERYRASDDSSRTVLEY